MSTKSGIVVCRASYRKVFSASFRRMSFSTATPVTDSCQNVPEVKALLWATIDQGGLFRIVQPHKQ